MAFIMGIAAVALVWKIASKVPSNQVLGLILGGIMISSLFQSGTSFIKLVADPEDELPAITYFLMGSLAGAGRREIGIILLPMVISALPVILLSWRLNLLSLPEEEARSLGVNTKAIRAVMIAAVLMVLTGCLRSVEAAYKTINWETIVLFGAMLPMSLALEKTGVSQYLADALAKSIGGYGPTVLLAGVYFTTSLMTMFISNTVTAVLMAPIALQSAVQASVSPVPFLFAVTVAASMCFASPFSTPPNALVMPAGQYSFADYVKVGLPLQVIMGLVMIVALPLLFPF